jgi:hypothetical protein
MVTLRISMVWAVAAVVGWTQIPGAAGGEDMQELKFELPPPVFEGTREDIKLTEHMKKPWDDKLRPAVQAPKGTVNVALGKPVAASDDEPMVGETEMLTDGDKKGTHDSFVELGPGRQWVQIDLERVCTIHYMLVWHYHREQRIYHDVVVQVADDPDFITNVRTVYNNDYDNTSGLGIGKDKEYFEDYQGRLMPAKGVKARYVRLYSNGCTDTDLNHYTEVEVWGKPVK